MGRKCSEVGIAPQVLYAMCKFKGEIGDKGMTHCGLCMRWCHPVCTDNPEDVKYAKSSWPCPTCRAVSSKITRLQSDLSIVMALLCKLTTAKEVKLQAAATDSHGTEPSDHSGVDSVHTLSESESESEVPAATTITADIHTLEPRPSESDDETDSEDSSESDVSGTCDDEPSSHPDDNIESDYDSIWLTQRSQKRRTKRRRVRVFAQKPKHSIRFVCDSLPKNVSKQYIARKCSADVEIIQSGATIGKAVDYILHAETEHETPIIIHSGTNNLEKEGVKRTFDRLDRLEHNLVKLQYRHVLLSSIVYRGHTTPTMCENIKHVNTRLAMMCAKHKWIFIDNDNIEDTCLDADGVHLNSMGDDRLTMNIVRGINYMFE